MGLVSALQAYARGFNQRTGIQVEVKIAPDFGRLSREMEATLFRIVQEGLRNLKKHSGAAKAEVHLRKAADKLFVSVSDEGIGFDIRELIKKEGLGIRSMKERVYLLGGRFEIHSEPGKGTRIEAWVALQPKSELATR